VNATTALSERILSEERLPLDRIPGRNGRQINNVTAWRWITKGLLTPTGERVRLEAIKVGSAWTTSREALERFTAALTPAFQTEAEMLPRTPVKRQRASEAAVAELIRRGC
jgi:hypothetical protein